MQKSSASASAQSVTIDDAFSFAARLWREGKHGEAHNICKQIIAVRPRHQAANHLLMMLEHNVSGLVFTAVGLFNPVVYDIGDFSYGVPAVFEHNQPHEPARLSIGSFCTIAHNVQIFLGSYHRADTFSIYPFSAPHFGSLFASARHIQDYSSTKGGVSIGSDVWIGAGAQIMAGVSIGNGAVIGAGAVVTQDVGDYEIWAGNPASFRKRRFDEAISERLLSLNWWSWPKELIESHARTIISATEEALSSLEAVKRSMLEQKNAALRGDAKRFTITAGKSGFLRVKMPEVWKADKPTWLVLHGSLGLIESVSVLSTHLLDANLIYIDLPGCGASSPPAEMSVSGFAAEILPALDELMNGNYQIVGASFGGSVALEIAKHDAKCHGVVLLDTPFSASKLWHNHAFLRRSFGQRPDDRYLRQFALSIYGVTETAAVDRDYWQLLDGLSKPVTVITGDVPMLPQRAMPPVPCCLDEDDLKNLAQRGVQVVRISGGHDLMNDNPSAVAEVLRGFA